VTDADFLASLGLDAQTWTDAFVDLLDEGEAVDSHRLLGWFANAIEAGRSAGYAAAKRDEFEKPEQFTCATAHLSAERALRIIENGSRLGEPVSSEAIDAITHLCDQAGVQFARRAVEQQHPF
jgi:hypothetical protein